MVYRLTKPREALFSLLFSSLAYYLVTAPESMVPDAYGWFQTIMFSLFAVFAVFHAVHGLPKEQHLFGKSLKVGLTVASGLFLIAAFYTSLLLL